MRASRFATALLAALLLGTASAAAAVNVTFVKPEKYRDDDFRSASKRKGVIRELTRHFERLDKRYLTAGEQLEITVLDARLAGRYEPWQPTFNDVRILRETTPPRFVIHYALRQNGKIIASGEETVSDLSYMWRASARHSTERLACEKDMLRDWFRKRLVELKPPRG